MPARLVWPLEDQGPVAQNRGLDPSLMNQIHSRNPEDHVSGTRIGEPYEILPTLQ